MTIKTIMELRSKFEKGDQPEAQDFIDLIDSFLHAGLSNFPNPLPAVSGKNLTEIGDALPAVLPARDGSQLTNINPKEYNVPGSMPVPSYATANTFVLTGDFTVGAADVNNRIFLIGRRLRIKIGGNYEYTEVSNAVFAAGITTVTTLDNMSGSPIQEVAVGVITPFALGGGVSPGTIGFQNLGQQIFTTGDAKLTFKTVADAGWIMANDGSIGKAGSGATTRANDDTEPLYTLLWTNIPNTWAPVSGGRGANAAADFAAGKTLTIPRLLGRALAVAGAGSGLTSRALGEYLGAETETPTIAKTAGHEHDPASVFARADGGTSSGYSAGNGFTHTSDTTAPAGGGAALNIMQPSGFFNAMVKL